MTSRILALTAVVLTAAANLHAAPTNVWSGGGADDNWSTADNWTNGAPGAFAAGLLFAGTNRLATTNNVVVEAFLLDHDATAGTFVHGGDAVTFVEEAGVAPVIRNGSANAQTINFNVSNGNAGDGTLTVDAAAGPLAFGGAVSAAGGARTLVITGSGEVTFGGAVQDGAGAALTVIKRGTGTGILSVASGYTGPTVVEDGVLAAAGALATPSITASGGVFAATADNILPDAAPVHVASGAFAALGNDSIGLLSAAGGTVYLASGKVLTASFAGTGLVAAALQGGGSLAKTGAGVLELSATGSVLNTLRVGAGATGGEVALAGGSIAGTGPMPRFIVGSGAAGSGILTVRDGTHVFGGDGYASSGDIGESGGAGALTIENGSLSVATSGGTPASLRLGCNGTANGTLTVNGGALNVPGRILMAANNAGAVGTLTLNGGEVNLGDGGGGVFDPGRGRLWMGAGLGTARLNGGTLTLFDFAGGSTNARIYLNGATVKPVTNNTAFVNGTFAFLVSSNGAIFDTAGWNITVGSALAHDAALGADPDGGLAKFGAGTLTLTGGNAYSNDTVVHAGTLALAGGGTPGAHNTAPVRVGLGAALFFQRSDTFGSHIAATIKPIVVEQGGLITNGNVFNQLGPVTLAGGRIESGGGAGVFGFQSFGLTRTITATGDVTAVIAQGAAASNAEFLVSNPVFFTHDGASDVDLDVPATLVGYRAAGAPYPELATGFIKSGPGLMRLGSVSNRYGGNTIISNGTLRLGASGVIPDGTNKGDLVVAAGVFDLGGFDETINGLAGAGAVDNTIGDGLRTLTLGNADHTTTFNGVIRDTTGTVAVTKIGTGVFTLSGAGTYHGDTTVSNGTFAVAGAGRPGDLTAGVVRVMNGAALSFNRHDTYGNHMADVVKLHIVEAGGLITNGNNYTTLGAVILAGGRIHAGGGATPGFPSFGLTKTITATGDTTSVIASAPAANTHMIIKDPVFDVYDGAAATDLEVSANLRDYFNNAYVQYPCGFTKAGAGRMLVSGSNTFNGAVAVSDGALEVSGSLNGTGAVTVAAGAMLLGAGGITGAVDVAGTLAPGASPGRLATGPLTLQAGSRTVIEVDKDLGTNDSVACSSVIYGGTLIVTNIGTTNFMAGDWFTIFAAGAYSGAFATLEPAAPGPGLAWDTSLLEADGSLGVVSSVTVTSPVVQAFSRLGTTNLVLVIDSQAGVNYVLETATNLVGPVFWDALGTNAGTGAPLTNSIPVDPAKPRLFLRYITQ